MTKDRLNDIEQQLFKLQVELQVELQGYISGLGSNTVLQDRAIAYISEARKNIESLSKVIKD